MNTIPLRGDALMPVGVARVNITPTQPIRLSGYVARTTNSGAVAQHLFARALAIGPGTNAAVLITVDNCAIPWNITQEIHERLRKKSGIQAERIAITCTHTHTAPHLAGAIGNMFAGYLPPEQTSAIEAYTRFFTDQIEAVALAALARREPARLKWGSGKVGFSKNRRTEGGPVDHDVPLLEAAAPDGQLRAVWMSYACHCTSIDPGINQCHADWAGVAAEDLERQHAGLIALVSIGCGADSNPNPRGKTEDAEKHGHSLAAEAARLIETRLVTLTNAPNCGLKQIELPYQTHFTRAQWEQRAKENGIVGFHARRWLERMDKGEAIPASLNYPIQTWVFGDQLAIIFLGGEVVVDYSLRLKGELDSSRIWINAYANDVPCYIPSRRILSEGGYEAEVSLWYYDRPQKLSPEIEDRIIQAVHELLPPGFRMDSKRTVRTNQEPKG